MVAALAGNVVMLVGGVEIAGVGTLLMTSAGRGRPGRGGLVAIGLEHLASLGLVVAAVQLLSVAGTTDFAVIPAGALGATVAGPWAAAGVDAPALAGVRSDSGYPNPNRRMGDNRRHPVRSDRAAAAP